VSACHRCEVREAVPHHHLCRACRYYQRSGEPALVQTSVYLPPLMLAVLHGEAEDAGVTFSEVVRRRLRGSYELA
jgi:hypothetical protein